MVKNLPANAGDTGSVPESGRSPGVGVDTGAWWTTVHKGSQRVGHTQVCAHLLKEAPLTQQKDLGLRGSSPGAPSIAYHPGQWQVLPGLETLGAPGTVT